MAEYKLDFTAEEINGKLQEVESLKNSIFNINNEMGLVEDDISGLNDKLDKNIHGIQRWMSDLREQIDPVVMDCDNMGITETLGELLATGGGESESKSYGDYGANHEFWMTEYDTIPRITIVATVGDGYTFFTPSFVNMDNNNYRVSKVCADVYVEFNGLHKCFVEFTPIFDDYSIPYATGLKMVYLGTVEQST